MEEEYCEEYAEGEGLDHGDEAWGIGEIAVAPIFHGDAVDFATALRFDAAEESLWAGTNAGVIAQSLCPDLHRFAEVAAHHDGIIAMRSAGNSCVSLSHSQLSLHFSGCVPRIWFLDEVSWVLFEKLSGFFSLSTGINRREKRPYYNIPKEI